MAKNGPIAKTVFTSPGQLPTHISLDQLKNSLNALESYAANVQNCNCFPENCCQSLHQTCQNWSLHLSCQSPSQCGQCTVNNCSCQSTAIHCQFWGYLEFHPLYSIIGNWRWDCSMSGLRNGQCYNCCQVSKSGYYTSWGDCDCGVSGINDCNTMHWALGNSPYTISYNPSNCWG